jgi:hypothetical protein
MAQHTPVDDRPLSEILRELGEAGCDVPLEDFVQRFGSRAFGAILFIFAAACALPLPPGSSTFLGAPLVLLSPQVALGATAPWLPHGVRRRTISAATLRKLAQALVPTMKRIEHVSRPRLAFLFSGLGGRVIGVVCTLLSLVLILPIPLGNLLPATAVALLALGLVQRDGVLALAGYSFVLASTAVLVVAARIVIRAARHLLEVIGAA